MSFITNGMELKLNTFNNKAKLSRIVGSNNIIIPRSVIYDNEEYTINVICQHCLENNANITSIRFSHDSEVEFIESEAFSLSALRSIVFPPNTRILNDYIFCKCQFLDSVQFPTDSKLTTILKNSFFDTTQLEKLVFPNSVCFIEEGWCSNTPILKSVEFHPENDNFKILDNGELIGRNDRRSKHPDILLFGPRDLKKAIIPSYVFRVGDHAFNDCTQLSTIEIEERNDQLSIGSYSFSKTNIEEIYFPNYITKIDTCAFEGCKQLKSIVFQQEGATVTTIENEAFLGSQVENLVFPKSLEKCHLSAFFQCKNLTQVVFLSDKIEIKSIFDGILNGLLIVELPNVKSIFFNFASYVKYNGLMFVVHAGAEIKEREK